MELDLSWLKEENWATDLFSDIVKGWLVKPKETAPISPQVGATYGMTFGDWVIPVTVVGVVGVIVLILFFSLKRIV